MELIEILMIIQTLALVNIWYYTKRTATYTVYHQDDYEVVNEKYLKDYTLKYGRNTRK